MNRAGPDSATPDWLTSFPALQGVDDAAWREILSAARPLEAPAGTVLFRDGDACRNYLLLQEGSVRVHKVTESGREIVLYRVEAGQACVLTTACLLACEMYPAEGVAETDVRGVVIPMERFQDGLSRSDGFRSFVFAAYAKRISDLILLVEEVAFGRMDVRLAQCLLERAGQDGEVRRTHQELAVELGTAREVVSRQLKDFERRHWVVLSRGRISVVDRAALDRLGARDAM